MKFFNFALLVLPLTLAAPISHAADVPAPDAEMVGGFTDDLTLTLSVGGGKGLTKEPRQGTVTVTGPKRLEGEVFTVNVSGPGLTHTATLTIGSFNSSNFDFRLPSEQQDAEYSAVATSTNNTVNSNKPRVRVEISKPRAKIEVTHFGWTNPKNNTNSSISQTHTFSPDYWEVSAGTTAPQGFIYRWSEVGTQSHTFEYQFPKGRRFDGTIYFYVATNTTDVPISNGAPASNTRGYYRIYSV